MWRVVLVVIVLLVAFRLALPYIVTRYVNKVLNDIEGYSGSISDIDIHLYRGAYQIDSIKIYKTDGAQRTPFVSIPKTDLSIEWNALFDGALVGEITFEKPVLNFIAAHDISNNESGDSTALSTTAHVDWTVPIKKLLPVPVNRLRVNNGKIAFYDFAASPEVGLFLNNVQLDALNLNNTTENPEPLPSRIYLQALSIGNGQLNIAMKANVLKAIPDLDMDLRFESVNLRALHELFQAYGNVNVEHGNFNMYSEVAVLDGEISGYVKPLFHELNVENRKDEKDESVGVLWESLVSFLNESVRNETHDQVAAKAPLVGHIASAETPFWPSLWNIFSNAFVDAFDQNTEESFSVATASTASSEKIETAVEKKEDPKSKKEVRKERRREKREEKKRAKKEKKERDGENNDVDSRGH